MSNSLQPHESQHSRPPCPSPAPGVHSNLCPSSWWCHPTITSSVFPFSSCSQSLPESGSFPVSQLFPWVARGLEFQLQHQFYQWKPGLISFRMDWLDLLAVQGTPESSPTPQFKRINSSVLSFLYSPTLIFIHVYWKVNQMLWQWDSGGKKKKKTTVLYGFPWIHPKNTAIVLMEKKTVCQKSTITMFILHTTSRWELDELNMHSFNK